MTGAVEVKTRFEGIVDDRIGFRPTGVHVP
jgi:hypothetical protein